MRANPTTANSAALLLLAGLVAGCPSPMSGLDGGSGTPEDAGVEADAGSGCGSGLTRCGSACMDLRVQDEHCGACGNACPSMERCAGGACAPRHCADITCGPTQVCASGVACVERRCLGVACGSDQVCVDGVCTSNLCGSVACPPGLACEAGRCVDRNCQGVVCGPGRACAVGGCVGSSGQPVRDFSSGGSLGAVQRNETHQNRGVLGEPTPPLDGVEQRNGTHFNRAGVVTGLQKD